MIIPLTSVGSDHEGDAGVIVTPEPPRGEPCCICGELTTDGPISTGDINNPTMKPCCNRCFKDLVCP